MTPRHSPPGTVSHQDTFIQVLHSPKPLNSQLQNIFIRLFPTLFSLPHFYIPLISFHFPYNITGFLLVVFSLQLTKRSFRTQTFLHSLPPSSDIERQVEEVLMKRSTKEKEEKQTKKCTTNIPYNFCANIYIYI